MLYIGVDLGTSAVKLLLMDGAGHIEKIVSITKNEAYDMAIELFKHGHDYGITTAANIVAATKSGLANKNILVINYDSIQKYLNVLNKYVTSKFK